MNEDFAIIIGINDYTPPNQKGLRTLQGAIRDAEEFEKWILSVSGGNVPASNIRKIISVPNPLKPLQDEIDDAFLAIEQGVKTNGGNAKRFYFYFAGHGLGTLDNTDDTALCLANWSEHRRHSALSSESYKDFIKQYGYFEEIIFIADCCRNTKINIKPKSPTFAAIIPGPRAGRTKLFVAYATQYQDQSFEVESGTNSEMRGAFTKVLLNGLQGDAANGNTIGADDLRDFLSKQTPEEARLKGYKQFPDVTHTFPGNITLVTVPPRKVNVKITFSQERNNDVELLDEELRLLDTLKAHENKDFDKQLLKGKYLLRDTITGASISFEVLPTQPNSHVSF